MHDHTISLLAFVLILACLQVNAHTVPGGDIDPTHSHNGLHSGEFPFHTHDPQDPHMHGDERTTPPPPRDIVDIAPLSLDELTITPVLTSSSFLESYGTTVLMSYRTRIMSLSQTIQVHADANHARDGNHPRGYYDRGNLSDPTTQWLTTRFLHIVHSDVPPLPYNPLANACLHSRCKVPNNRFNPDQSQCRVFNETYGEIQCVCTTRLRGLGPFYNENSTCHECSEDPCNDECTKCGDSTYLYMGECIAECPPYTRSIGSGRFRRICEPFDCIENRDSCGVCNEDNSACTRCRYSAYLHEGECHAECPTGFIGAGSGRWGRICEYDGCIPNRRGCRRCNLDRTACTICGNYMTLYNGSCTTQCPAGYEIKPGGYNPNSRYNRECIPELPVSDCRGLRDNCQRCDGGVNETAGLYGDNCVQCRDSTYLQPDGTCLPTCPSGYRQVGSGRWNRVCR